MEHIRQYQLFLIKEKKVSRPTFIQKVCAAAVLLYPYAEPEKGNRRRSNDRQARDGNTLAQEANGLSLIAHYRQPSRGKSTGKAPSTDAPVPDSITFRAR